MTNENKNSLIIFIGLLLIIIYTVTGILSFFDECIKQNQEQIAENAGICYDCDDTDNNEDEEDIEEEEPIIQCPPSRPITSYELFQYNINILAKPSFLMING